jgi:hypothetical protein
MSIDISGIDRDVLLEALWKGSFYAPFFKMSGLPPPEFDIKRAKSELRNNYADYVCGKVIKADVYSKDSVDPSMYDRDNGPDAFKKIVDSLRII